MDWNQGNNLQTLFYPIDFGSIVNGTYCKLTQLVHCNPTSFPFILNQHSIKLNVLCCHTLNNYFSHLFETKQQQQPQQKWNKNQFDANPPGCVNRIHCHLVSVHIDKVKSRSLKSKKQQHIAIHFLYNVQNENKLQWKAFHSNNEGLDFDLLLLLLFMLTLNHFFLF